MDAREGGTGLFGLQAESMEDGQRYCRLQSHNLRVSSFEGKAGKKSRPTDSFAGSMTHRLRLYISKSHVHVDMRLLFSVEAAVQAFLLTY